MKTKVEKKEVPSFDELVFEKRNKEYGAYEIRRKYNMTLVWAILVGAFCVSATVITPFFIKPAKVIVVDTPSEPRIVNMDSTLLNIQNVEQEKQKPTEVIKTPTLYQPVVVDTVLLENQMSTIEDQINNTNNDPVDTGVVVVAYVDPNPPIDDPDKIEQAVNVAEKPYFGVEGDKEFLRWVAKNLIYPQRPLEAGIQGRIFLQFVIEKDGSLSNIKVLRSVDPELDREAIRVLELSPKWNPGKQQGRPVRVYYTFPITFAISQ
jgi:periplasmic protein TonB